MKMFLSFLTGAALGALFGVLFAPDEGKETRRRIREYTDKLTDDFKDEYDKISGRTKTLVAETKGKLQEKKDSFRRKNKFDEVEPIKED